MTFGRGPHQRRLPSPALRGVGIGTAGEQVHGIDRAGSRRDHQRGLAVAIGRTGVGAGLEQHRQRLRVAVHRGQPQRCRAVAIGGFHVGAGANEHLDDLGLLAIDRPVQRCRAVGLRRIHIDAFLDQRADTNLVTSLDRIDQRDLRMPVAPANRTRAAPRERLHIERLEIGHAARAVHEAIQMHADFVEQRQVEIGQRRRLLV